MPGGRAVTAKFFDDIYRAYERSATLPALMRSTLGDALPVEVQPYSFVTMGALREVTERLQLGPGALLADVACGRGGPGMWVARCAGVDVIGIDFSTVAVAQAIARIDTFQLARRAQFRVGTMEATGLADAQVDAVMCVDSLQFSGDPGLVVREASRILRPGGRAVFTTWEARKSGDSRVPQSYAWLDAGRLMRDVGFTGVVVAERPEWHQHERAVLERALDADSSGDPAILQLQSEATRIIAVMPHVRRVIVCAVKASP